MKKFSYAKRVLSLAVATLMTVSVMAGCAQTQRAGDSAASGATKSGNSDTFTFAQGADPRGLDPAMIDDGESAKVLCNIYEGLMKYKEDSTELEPCLAESYDLSTDNKTYTFHLRKGVKFQDGTPFNAEAVKKSIDRQLEPNVTDDMPYASFVFGSIKDKSGVKEVRAKDENTVEIELFSPQTSFLANMAMVMAAPIVSPTACEKNNNNLNEAPCGTGPYKFVKWDKGQSIVLVANDDYWGTKPKTKNIVFRFIKENSARVIALTSGEVDAIDGIDATVVDQIKNGGDKLFEADGMNINYMAYNMESATFKNADARKSFSQAINVPEMVKSLYKDYASQASSIMPSFMEGYSDSIKQTAFDKDAAKAGLEKAGVKTVKMVTYSNPRPYNTIGGQSVAEAIQGYLKDVGVDCQIKTYDWTTYKDIIKKGDYDVCFYGWTGDNGDPDNFMNLLSDKDPTMNVSRYNDAAYTDLIKKGLATPDGADRAKVYTDCENKVAAENIWLPISHSKLLAAYGPTVKGFTYHQTGVTHLENIEK